MVSRKSLVNPLWLFVPDLLWMFLALQVVLYFRYENISKDLVSLHYQIFGAIFLVWTLVLFIHNLFESKTLNRYSSLFYNLISAMFINFVIAVIYFYFQPSLILTPRRTLLAIVLISSALIFIWHALVKYFLKNKLAENYYLYSLSDDLSELEKELDLPIKRINSLKEVRNGEVIISHQLFLDEIRLKEIYESRLKGIRFHNHVEFSERLLKRVPLTHLNELWFLNNIEFRETRLQGVLRRFIDLSVGMFLLVLFIITFPFIALAVRRPLFFTQLRIGKNNEPFKVYKYRTMKVDSSGKGWTAANDERITPVGKFLRRLHLDELPQFINLLRGNMSVVGPRPEQLEIVAEINQLIPFYGERHMIKPGLTGWAQLNIYASTIDETRRKLEYDLYYLKYRSFLFDVEIILKTLYFVIRNKI